MLDKTPQGHQAGFPFDSNPPPPCTRVSLPSLRFQSSPVSEFPRPCLNHCIPYHDLSTRQEPMGLPKFFNVSLTACHGLWTPTDLLILANADGLVLPSGTLKPSTSVSNSSRSCTSTSGCADTPTAYRILCVRFAHMLFAIYCLAPQWTQHSIRVGG